VAKRKQAVTNRKIQITSRFYFRLAAAFVFVILFLGFVSIILSIEFQKSLIEFRKLELKRLVTLAYNSVESHLAEYAKGHIGRDEAASRVRTTVRQFIYNDPSGENYIFVHSYDGTMLVQPFEPFKEGTNQWNLQDANGVYIIRELVAAARKGSGFVEYRYPPPGSTVPQRKISYVVGIPLLDCYIGTGMYLSDIQSIVRTYFYGTAIYFFLASIVLFLLVIVPLAPILRVYRVLYNCFLTTAQDTATPNEGVSVSSFREGSEARVLLDGFLEMMQRIQDNERDISTYARFLEKEMKERHKAEELLKRKAQELELIIDNLPAYIFFKDTNSVYITANRKFCEVYGLSQEEITGKTEYDIFTDNERIETYLKTDRRVIEQRQPISAGEDLHEEDGRTVYTMSHKVPLMDENGNVIGIIGIAFDVTELKEAQQRLAASLREKDTLFKEVHHRVKNNMQIISSLLNLQSYQMSDEHDRELLLESINRIQSMSMVHEMLYQSGNVTEIDLSLYMRNLISYIFSMYAVGADRIALRYDHMETIPVDIDTAINCGLIITEIITNSIKYAFPGLKAGKISISLKLIDGRVIIEAGDDGIGMDIHSEKRSTTLGLSLIESLVHQLEGSMDLRTEGGTCYTISFPLNHGKASGT